MFTNHSRFKFFSAQQYVTVGCIEDKQQRHHREVLMSRWFCLPLSHRHLFIPSLVVSMIAFVKKNIWFCFVNSYNWHSLNTQDLARQMTEILGVCCLIQKLPFRWLFCNDRSEQTKRKELFYTNSFYIHWREACVTSNISRYCKIELNLPIFEIYLIHVHALLTWGEGIMLYF